MTTNPELHICAHPNACIQPSPHCSRRTLRGRSGRRLRTFASPSARSFAHGSLNSRHYHVSTKNPCSPAPLSLASSASASFFRFHHFCRAFPVWALITLLFVFFPLHFISGSLNSSYSSAEDVKRFLVLLPPPSKNAGYSERPPTSALRYNWML